MNNAECGLLTNPEPPESYYITADCGCEVYEGTNLIVDNDSGISRCEECFRDEIDAQLLSKLADHFNATVRVVTRKEILP